MITCITLIGAGPFEVGERGGGVGRCMGDLVWAGAHPGLGKKFFFLNLYLVIEFFADTQRCEIFFSAL